MTLVGTRARSTKSDSLKNTVATFFAGVIVVLAITFIATTGIIPTDNGAQSTGAVQEQQFNGHY
ncbi:MAG: hypothetical protein U0K57_10575 [Lachnospiraceae bacterium]|nr:hypothetical protein [Lachnospiraceae bacterium]